MWVKGIGCFSILLLDRESSPFVLTETCVPRARVPYIYTRACEWGSVSSSFAAVNHARRRCSCRESNPDLIFRRDLFYPLNYKSIKKGIPLYPNLVNLKSNTMKNTMQRYGSFGHSATKCISFLPKVYLFVNISAWYLTICYVRMSFSSPHLYDCAWRKYPHPYGKRWYDGCRMVIFRNFAHR